MSVAAAHVGVNPGEVPPDTSQVFAVRVPTERNEPTVAVRVEFPPGLTVSRFQPKPGWTYEVEKDSSGKTVAVTWSGGRIGPDEYDEFVFIGRTPKETGALVFNAYQTYGSGEVVEWTGPSDGEKPAPTVEVRPAPSGGTSSAPNADRAAGAGADASQTSSASSPGAGSWSPPGAPFWLSLAALAVASVALVLSATRARPKA